MFSSWLSGSLVLGEHHMGAINHQRNLLSSLWDRMGRWEFCLGYESKWGPSPGKKKKLEKKKGPSVYWESEICPPAFLHDLNVIPIP